MFYLHFFLEIINEFFTKIHYIKPKTYSPVDSWHLLPSNACNKGHDHMMARHNQAVYNHKAQSGGDEQDVDDNILYNVGEDILIPLRMLTDNSVLY